MRLDGRRQSSNVDDRRGRRGAFPLKAESMGIGGLIVLGIITWIMGGNPLSVLTGGAGIMGSEETTEYVPTQQEEELAEFSRQVLASTEDVWTEVFNEMGATYRPPTLVLFTGSVQSGCGNASAQTGPFYCSADEKLYIDLSFFSQMRQNLGADGDFAYAYVIAHEVGHHVQHLLGTLDKAHTLMARQSQTEANRTSVRIELQADFLAGVWGYHENRIFRSLEDGDLEEAITTASVIGDDYLQKQAQGYAVPESFNHGRSDQRMRWLKKGLTTGDISRGDTFTLSYDSL
ncbi:MAG: zinc metallopeptidase [Bacteroides sp.]|nr:zinc metallopeptidase [Bacteroides sp.]MCM1389135.1 zinc metallopeptidase [Bacteroides sp.]